MGENKVLITFFTQYGALHYSKLLEREGFVNRTKPVPRNLSSSCGICVEVKMREDPLHYLTEDVEKILRLQPEGSMELLFEHEDAL